MKLTKKQHAFTMIELIIIIAILAVFGVVIMTAWPSDQTTLRGQAKLLASDIRYIQHLSMTQNTRYRIDFSSTQYAMTTADGLTPVTHPGSDSNIISFSAGITLTTLGLPANYLVFDGRGIPYIDNSIPGTLLAATATLTLAATDGSTATILVSPETGKVTTND